MRIGLLSNFWHIRGGLERVMFADAEGLERRGHIIAPFASAHPDNRASDYSSTFPMCVDHGSLGIGMSWAERAATAVRLFHNRSAAEAFDHYADLAKPELVHQHGISRQFSPAVLERAHSRGIPTVLSLHDYSLACPSGDLSRPGAAECRAVSCLGHRYDRAVRFGCVHGSRAASAVAAAELLEARALRRYERSVDLFLVPSEYVRDRMVKSGLPASRLRVMSNAIESGTKPSALPADGHVLAYGRLVGVKGFRLVVEAARRLPTTRFTIAGDGPELETLHQSSDGLQNVSLVGLASQQEVTRLLRGSRMVIVPSEWPEPFGMVVLEAWREARPVVVTRRGALPDIVGHERTGIVIEPSDVEGAVGAIRRLIEDVDLATRLGMAGYRETLTTYGMDTHLDLLEGTYAELAGRRPRGGT